MRRAAAAVLCALGLVAGAGPARADGPGDGSPAVVAVGDSAISGEAGRWAGNSNGSPSRVDALGPTAYYDNAANTAETIRGCHRSKAAEIHIGTALSANLACSGARTYTQPFAGGSDFKPGLDFYDDGQGHIGQAKALQQYAATRNVKMVVVLIGANNFGFASVVQRCLTNWLTSPSWWKNYCHDDSAVTSMFTPSYIAQQRSRVIGAFANLETAMANAGYAPGSYTLVAQTYSSPIPNGSGFRYPETGFTRQSIGGCGVWNRDADWANSTMVTTLNGVIRDAAAAHGVPVLDAESALAGHRLCENTVGLLEEKGIASWTSPGAADRTEWVSQIRTVTTLVPPYQLQEDLHPSYWGQKALRNCVRQAYDGGTPHGGTCTGTGGLNSVGEPNMTLY
jgi:GDSL-like Lipase/Acylhydrolase family